MNTKCLRFTSTLAAALSAMLFASCASAPKSSDAKTLEDNARLPDIHPCIHDFALEMTIPSHFRYIREEIFSLEHLIAPTIEHLEQGDAFNGSPVGIQSKKIIAVIAIRTKDIRPVNR